MKKTILFLTGTRADYGKLKPLMKVVEHDPLLVCEIFVTGMHTLKKYGYTAQEPKKDGFKNIFIFMNQHAEEPMEEILSNTITGLSRYVHETRPDLLVVHGDRVEALAGAIVGSINNIPVAHIEGGERSGTIDEHIRHAVSKMSHIHLASNEEAVSRLVQMGEEATSIYNIGSPDIDIMLDEQSLPSIEEVKAYYDIPFDKYSILMYHPVTTSLPTLAADAEAVVEAVLASGKNFLVIYPNNDEGSRQIISAYAGFEGCSRVKIYPSIRFEYFLTLMRHSDLVMGNSSAGIREAPVYNIPSINIGNRQDGRVDDVASIVNASSDVASLLSAIEQCAKMSLSGAADSGEFGEGKSAELFKKLLDSDDFWNAKIQKLFVDIGDKC
ncbi:UDP-N-acetylglucosamine 2-epimerase (hydrolysing) [Sinobacterium caligoides]|uniref:UDP-N-acetylglucosamine 2-epimerase (Hydrolysing) n=1 Tax=Sinobacterium caligoides TaxID=933926 RepID=A0A3N2DPY7_9GAMM|nr:UDP-N-acetylglucosamine 2-epimerase [Sinobacterium caligoides]ROS01857.1 UDP-N-acetylglucosamine 2-epimerase (hydrolysing) [Sinobacterium caligoides]